MLIDSVARARAAANVAAAVDRRDRQTDGPLHKHSLPTTQPTSITKQVCVQHRASASNVTLLAFAAERRAAAPLLLSAGRAAIDRYLLLPGRTAANPPQRRITAGE